MKVVVLGNGLLGSELINQTGWDCISRKDGFDALRPKFSLLNKYDVIINCIANTDSYSQDMDAHMEVNYKFVVKLSDYCNKKGKKLVQISTEFVYANNLIQPDETDREFPDSTWYAKSKLLADQYITVTNPTALICRELHKSLDIKTYSQIWDVKTSGDTVDKIANLIIKLVEKQASGIFNVGTGSKPLHQLVPTASVIEPPAQVPRDTRMNLDKLNSFLNESY